MSVAAGDDGRRGHPLGDSTGTVLRGVSARLQAHCLVETEDGCVVAHALLPEPPPPHVVDAVLRRTSAPLSRYAQSSRKSSPLPGGPLLVGPDGDGSGWVHVAPLTRGGARIGWLWLLSQIRLTPEVLAPELQGVAGVLPAAAPDPVDLAVAASVSQGSPLPAQWVRAAHRAWVVTVSGRRPQEVASALTAGLQQLRLRSVDDGTRIRAVVLDDKGREPHLVEVRLQDAVARAGRRLDDALRAGISEPADPAAPLADAVRQADAAWRMSSSGCCTPVRTVRSRYALQVARDALRDLPDLGPDPVVLLREHDRLRTTQLSQSVRAWLDADGDVSAAAANLFIHANTLRYRLRKAQQVIGSSLDDVDLRIDLHLRLEP